VETAISIKSWSIFFVGARVFIGKYDDSSGGSGADEDPVLPLKPAFEITEDVFQMMEKHPNGAMNLRSHRVRDCHPILGISGDAKLYIGNSSPVATILCSELGDSDRGYLAELVNAGMKRAGDLRRERSPLTFPQMVVPPNIRRN
jgi:hypothetical protein